MKSLACALLLLAIFLIPTSAFAQLSVFCTVPSVTVCGASSMEYCVSESQYEVCLYLYLNGQPPYQNLPRDATAAGGGDTKPTGTLARPVPSAAKQQQAIDCANAYGQYQSRSGYHIYFQAAYGWGDNDTGQVVMTNTDQKPSTTSDWVPLDGNTDTVRKRTDVYVNGYSSFQNSIMTLEHEFTHQNGILDEDQAEQAAVNAINAWKANGGAQCAPDRSGTNSVDAPTS